MGSLRQPDKLTVLPQFLHSPYLTIHAFSLLHPLSPPPKSSLSVDDLAFYSEKTKATRRKPQQTPTISAIHLPELAPTHSALYPSKVKQCPFPCALNVIPYLSNIINFLSLLNHSHVHANMLLYLPFKCKNLINTTIPFLLVPLCTKTLEDLSMLTFPIPSSNSL